MKPLLYLSLAAIVGFALNAGATEDPRALRKWTSLSGTEVEATLLSVESDTAILKTPEGKKLRIPVNRLSLDDRHLLQTLSQSNTAESSVGSQEQEEAPTTWFTSYDDAKAQAKKAKKKLLILFTDSEFCKPCRELKSNVLESDVFLDYAKEKLVLFKSDRALERKDAEGTLATQTRKLMKKYPHRGVPWIFIARRSGSIIGQTGGYLGESPEQYIKERLKKYVK